MERKRYETIRKIGACKAVVRPMARWPDEGRVPAASEDAAAQWTRHNGVRHPCRGFGGFGHSCHHSFSPQIGGALDRDSRWYKQFVADTSGQSTVEYALVTGALLVVVVGLWAIRELFFQDVSAQHVLASASHHVSGAWGWVCDVLAF